MCKVFSNDFNMFLFETCNCFLSGLDQSYQLRKFLQTLCAALFLLFEFFSEDLSSLGLPGGISL